LVIRIDVGLGLDFTVHASVYGKVPFLPQGWSVLLLLSSTTRPLHTSFSQKKLTKLLIRNAEEPATLAQLMPEMRRAGTVVISFVGCSGLVGGFALRKPSSDPGP
jgi:hypothetical protein